MLQGSEWPTKPGSNAAAEAAQETVEEGRAVLVKRASKNLCVAGHFLL